MGKYKIGMLLGKPIVVGDRNIITSNEYYAEVDAENDDLTAIYQRGSRLTGKTDEYGFELVTGNRRAIDKFFGGGSSGGGGGNATVTYNAVTENLTFSGVEMTVV